MPYIDEYQLVHPRKDTVSENGILFRSVYSTFVLLNGRMNMYEQLDLNLAIMSTVVKEGRYQANPPQNGDHFSLDNMLGLYVCHILAEQSLKDLPIAYWNDRWHLHPNTWMVHLALKSWFFLFLFYVPLLLMATYSLYFREYHETTGRQLWFIRLLHLKRFKWFLKLYGAEKFKSALFYYWSNGFNYKNDDHPIYDEFGAWDGEFKI